MKLKIKVLNSTFERRELVGKDGVKASHDIAHIVGTITDPDTGIEVINCRTFDHPSFKGESDLPKVGSDWISPPVRKYENYTGVAEVSV